MQGPRRIVVPAVVVAALGVATATAGADHYDGNWHTVAQGQFLDGGQWSIEAGRGTYGPHEARVEGTCMRRLIVTERETRDPFGLFVLQRRTVTDQFGNCGLQPTRGAPIALAFAEQPCEREVTFLAVMTHQRVASLIGRFEGGARQALELRDAPPGTTPAPWKVTAMVFAGDANIKALRARSKRGRTLASMRVPIKTCEQPPAARGRLAAR